MRAESLQRPLNQHSGIGKSRMECLERLGLVTVKDLVLNRPRRYEDRKHLQSIASMELHQPVLVGGTISVHGVKRFRKGTKSVYEFVLEDGTGRLHCRWWNMPYMEEQFGVGMQLFVYGKPSGKKPWTMDHPETEKVELDQETTVHTGRVVPVYRLTEGLGQRWLRSLTWRILEELTDEDLESLGRFKMPNRMPVSQALRSLHFPLDLEAAEQARRRLALEEFVAMQRGLMKRRLAFLKNSKGLPCAGNNSKIRPFLRALGFQLTSAQTRVLREVRQDMGGDHPMRRLVHGDVGSGKTVVAACTTLMAIESGYSVALMAPTEILAGQHYLKFREWFRPLGIPVEFLSGKKRESDAESAAPSLTIGTHALIHQGYQPERLGLAIIDEQHRFGVVQRDKLLRKGFYPHLLVMTATPIPRTLGLTFYGDLDISVIDEQPAERGRVSTYIRGAGDLDKIWKFVRQQLKKGGQVYVIYPRLEERNERTELKSAIEEHDRLVHLLKPFRVGLIHGRLNAGEAGKTMEQFRSNEIQVLVATSVIEVGLDVPNANIMIIENAGSFGLSQLHQLRGRIGRGQGDATCILVDDSKSADSRDRCRILAETTDGFAIAEADFQMRGPGDFLGVRQSGMPQFRFADLAVDTGLLIESRGIAAALGNPVRAASK